MGMKTKTSIEATPVGLVPPVPSLPKTSVNPQPRQEASPVAPVSATYHAIKGTEVKRLNSPTRPNEKGKTNDNTMSKADWGAKDRAIERVAIFKSTLESSFLAQLTMGQDSTTALNTLKTVFEKAIDIFYTPKA